MVPVDAVKASPFIGAVMVPVDAVKASHIHRRGMVPFVDF